MSEPGSDDRPEPRPSDIDPDLEPAEQSRRWRDPRLPTLVAAVAVGGLIGAEARYGLGVALPHGPSQWPWATLLTNISGCFLIGVLMVVIIELVDAHPLARPLLAIGFLGGYTTFSTYTVDVVTLAHAGRWPLAVGYLVVTPVFAVLAAAAGAAATRTIAVTSGHHRHPARRSPAAEQASEPTSADNERHPNAENEGGK
jgi:fluoride exporter